MQVTSDRRRMEDGDPGGEFELSFSASVAQVKATTGICGEISGVFLPPYGPLDSRPWLYVL